MRIQNSYQSNRTTYPTPSIYVLQSVHLQLSGIQDLTFSLKFSNDSQLFSLSGNIVFHKSGPKLLSECSPLLTLSTFGLRNLSPPDLVPPPSPTWVNNSCIKGGDNLFFTLYISMANCWRFLWWIQTDLCMYVCIISLTWIVKNQASMPIQ